MTLKIALAQIDIALGQLEQNFNKIADFVRQAAAQNAAVVVFPEMWNTGYALSDLGKLADPQGQRSQQVLSQLAKQYHINIVGGSVATAKAGKFYNSQVIVDCEGQILSNYDKVHLFGPMDEEKYVSRGSVDNVFDLAGVKSAGVICYDLRFPEWVRTQMRQGAKILYVVAEWPEQRIEQWKILLQARAIENQAFVVGVNRVGADPNNRFNGHSLVIDPLGKILLDVGQEETLQVAELELAQVEQVRGFIPVFADRRPELYK
ncbi:carbon-nitrogen family hydrolase [Lactococcus kimchii]|uniref:carbon-nitrogen family hydrolase n=1 Tax=Lactococcus sp. S-13 TaxID=2507158 RepID=UPI001023E441|nr:carbon-nitrogen family hydrolase [Lactococcus sp. S-13]RZI49429.1 carbon-nitrogen family hydrolase [Lactococcus sp. S-13]